MLGCRACTPPPAGTGRLHAISWLTQHAVPAEHAGRLGWRQRLRPAGYGGRHAGGLRGPERRRARAVAVLGRSGAPQSGCLRACVYAECRGALHAACRYSVTVRQLSGVTPACPTRRAVGHAHCVCRCHGTPKQPAWPRCGGCAGACQPAGSAPADVCGAAARFGLCRRPAGACRLLRQQGECSRACCPAFFETSNPALAPASGWRPAWHSCSAPEAAASALCRSCCMLACSLQHSASRAASASDRMAHDVIEPCLRGPPATAVPCAGLCVCPLHRQGRWQL